VGQQRDAGAERAAAGAGQPDVGPPGEQPPAAAEHAREDEEAVLVDQAGADQRVAQGDAAGDPDPDPDLAVALAQQPADVLDGHVPADDVELVGGLGAVVLRGEPAAGRLHDAVRGGVLGDHEPGRGGLLGSGRPWW
jgi:hypothetical protein